VLNGEVATDQEKDRAEKIALIYINKERLVNVIAVNPDRQAARASKLVQITAHFVELNKSFLRNFNFSWTPIANVQATYNYPSGNGNPFNFFAVLTEFLPKLNTAKALGVARVFESPTVSVKSGNPASINSGNKLYVPVQTQDGAVFLGGDEKGEPLSVGVELSVTPTADDRDFVDMEISVQVSKLGSSPNEGSILVNQSGVTTSQYVRKRRLGRFLPASEQSSRQSDPFGF